MKQKDTQFKYDAHQIVYIVEKEDGTYGPVQAGSYMFEEYADDFREKLAYWTKQNIDDVASGAVSPVGYHIQRLHMTPADVASRIGLRPGQVKRHMSVRHFGTMKLSVAQRYAELFGVPLAGMFQVVIQPGSGAGLVHKRTGNPYMVLTQLEEPA